MKTNVLLLGRPKSGKSSLLESVIKNYDLRRGILTKEIREGDVRQGFSVTNHKGETLRLASRGAVSDYQVGEYGVFPKALEKTLKGVGIPLTDELLYIDEVGSMQLFSEYFRKNVEKYLNTENICIVTGSPLLKDAFMDRLIQREDVIIVPVTAETRDSQSKFLAALITKLKKAKEYSKDNSRFVLDEMSGRVSLRSKHGIRNLTLKDRVWSCDCAFYNEYALCSHSLSIDGKYDFPS